MGSSGLATRILAFRYSQSFLSFAAPDGAIKIHASYLANGTRSGMRQARIDGSMQDVYRVNPYLPTRSWSASFSPVNSSLLVTGGNRGCRRMRQIARLVPLEVGDCENVANALEVLEREEFCSLATCPTRAMGGEFASREQKGSCGEFRERDRRTPMAA